MYCVKTQLSCDVLSLKSHTLASYAQRPPKILVHCNIKAKTNSQISSGKFNNLHVLVIVLHEVWMEEEIVSVGEEGCQGIGLKVWVGRWG